MLIVFAIRCYSSKTRSISCPRDHSSTKLTKLNGATWQQRERWNHIQQPTLINLTGDCWQCIYKAVFCLIGKIFSTESLESIALKLSAVPTLFIFKPRLFEKETPRITSQDIHITISHNIYTHRATTWTTNILRRWTLHMVFAHRSFARATLTGSLFGQFLPRLVRLQLGIFGKTQHFWKQCLVFCSIVFQICFCQVFGQPILSCRSLALVLARGNLMEFRMAVLSDSRLASACAMSTSRP